MVGFLLQFSLQVSCCKLVRSWQGCLEVSVRNLLGILLVGLLQFGKLYILFERGERGYGLIGGNFVGNNCYSRL